MLRTSSRPAVVRRLLGALLAVSLLAPLAACGDKEPAADSDLPQCVSPYDENAFLLSYPSLYCRWLRICGPGPYDDVACADSQIDLTFCHEADPCLTEACIVALDRDFEEAPDDCALVPAACDGIFNLDVDRCAE